MDAHCVYRVLLRAPKLTVFCVFSDKLFLKDYMCLVLVDALHNSPYPVESMNEST
jgi:hypothetical protein